MKNCVRVKPRVVVQIELANGSRTVTCGIQSFQVFATIKILSEVLREIEVTCSVTKDQLLIGTSGYSYPGTPPKAGSVHFLPTAEKNRLIIGKRLLRKISDNLGPGILPLAEA